MKKLLLIIFITILSIFGNISYADENTEVNINSGVDSDADGITDNIDQEDNTDSSKVNYVCTTRDISNMRYNCHTIYGLGIYSPQKENRPGSEGVEYEISTYNNHNLQGGSISNSNNIETKLGNIKSDNDVGVSGRGGIDSIYNFILRVAKDLKTVAYMVSSIYFLILVMRLIFNHKAEEEITNFKKGIIWITLGLVLMQLAYGFTEVLYDDQIDANLAEQFRQYILSPITQLMGTLASIFFIAMAIFAFYRLVTSNGDEEKAKSGKITILHSIIGIIIIKLSKVLVESTYGAVNCGNDYISTACTKTENLDQATLIVVDIINWANSFVGIIVVILVIYSGVRILLSSGDEETLKKAKSTILFIAIGLFILIANYIILTFFILPENII